MFWIALVFFAIAIGGALYAIFGSDPGPGWGVFGVALVVGIVLTITACASTVEPRNIGIVTSFKKPTGETTGSGLQWTKPWETVADWDASNKIYDHAGNSCVTVRIAGGGQGCVEVTVGWRAAVPRGPENFASYRKTDKQNPFAVFSDRRVERPITAEVQSLFTTFDPFQGINADKISSGGLPPSPDLNSLYRQALTDRVNLAVGGGTKVGETVEVTKDDPRTKDVEDDADADVVVLSVTFGFIRYDEATNARLASYGQKLLENRNLLVDKANSDLRKTIAGQKGLTPFEDACLAQAGAYAGLCRQSGSGASVILPAK